MRTDSWVREVNTGMEECRGVVKELSDSGCSVVVEYTDGCSLDLGDRVAEMYSEDAEGDGELDVE